MKKFEVPERSCGRCSQNHCLGIWKIILCTQRRSTNISSASKPFSHDELYEEVFRQRGAIAWNPESLYKELFSEKVPQGSPKVSASPNFPTFLQCSLLSRYISTCRPVSSYCPHPGHETNNRMGNQPTVGLYIYEGPSYQYRLSNMLFKVL